MKDEYGLDRHTLELPRGEGVRDFPALIVEYRQREGHLANKDLVGERRVRTSQSRTTAPSRDKGDSRISSFSRY